MIFCISDCLGGAERLIVDAAVELASHGHNVHIFTSHHDRNRCFEETLSGNKNLSSSLHKSIHNLQLLLPFLYIQVHFQLQFMDHSFQDTSSIVFMQYARIFVAYLLPSVSYSTFHLLTLYLLIKSLLSFQF